MAPQLTVRNSGEPVHMRVYDLLLKLEGMKSLCGDGLTDDAISTHLFPVYDQADQRINLSRLKSGELELTEHLRNALAEDFNARINKNVLKANGTNSIGDVLQADDWLRPLPEFFGHLAQALSVTAPGALARAHTGIMAALNGLSEHRERHHTLLVEKYNPNDAEQYRFPAGAEPLDPEDLPPGRITAGKPMMAALTAEASSEPTRGWLFFIRNPDERHVVLQRHYVWDQDVAQLAFWHHGGPFLIPAHYTGLLPGYPTVATHLTGEVVAYLLAEPLNSPAVAELLHKPYPAWDGKSAPPFESLAHLITCARRLFQKGASRRYDKGQISYRPPKLFIRRYRVDA